MMARTRAGRRALCRLSHVVIAALACGAPALAQDYPARPLRIVITFPAGGPTDVIVRTIGQKLTDKWGAPIVIDNRGGGGGIVGTEIVAHAAPDGYTLLVGTAGGMSINPALHGKLSYDPFRDFAPVGMLVVNPQILVVHPAVPARTVKELVAITKAKPNQFNFASAGTGTATHLGLELLRLAAGIEAVHVPYKGGAPAITDLIAGQVQMLLVSIPSVLPHVRAGRLRAIAVTSARRSASAPDVPTIAEAGYPGFEYSNWNALFVPAATPAARIRKLNAEIVSILNDPEIIQRLTLQGADPAPGTPESLARYMRADHERWKTVIKAAGIKPE